MVCDFTSRLLRFVAAPQRLGKADAGEDRGGVDHRADHRRLRKGNETLAETSFTAHPGSSAKIGGKIAGCLEKYRRDRCVPPSAATFRRDLRARLHLPSLPGAMPMTGCPAASRQAMSSAPNQSAAPQ